ncbi:MAG: hypothetical protein R2706_01750 [Acidimicrobiales bacterium]
MKDLFFEGLTAVFYLSSLTLLIPGIATMLIARTESSAAAVGFVLATILVSWFRFSDNLNEPPGQMLAAALAIATGVLVAPLVRRVNLVTGAAGAVAGGVAALSWWPALGTYAGPLFVGLGNNDASGLVDLTIYMVGIFMPLILGASALALTPKAATLPFRPIMLFGGGGVLGVFTLLLFSGTMPDLANWLAERTIETLALS